MAQKTQLLNLETVEGERIRGPRASLFKFLFVRILAFLWVAPITTLLVLNFTAFRIGPSAWCFRGHCPTHSLDADAIGKAKSLDKADHNTLGALQLVAKALEIWFAFVAMNLIYRVVMWLASRQNGLPIGLFAASMEFADPCNLLAAVRSLKRDSSHHEALGMPTSKLPIVFAAFLLFMCVLVNLMGPATAVLILPTLQWIDLEHNAKHTVRDLNLTLGPAGDNCFPQCSEANLRLGQYSCNSDSYAASLDAWVDITLAGESQSPPLINGSILSGLSQEGHVLFTFNSTYSWLGVKWPPNRQALRELSADLDNFQSAYLANKDKVTDPGYMPYTHALQTILKRQGPVIRAYGGYYYAKHTSDIGVGPNQSLRCFDDYKSTVSPKDQATYTKCIHVGKGWSLLNDQASFSIVGSDSSETSNITVYFSDKAVYYEDQSSMILSNCVANLPNNNFTECSSLLQEGSIPTDLTPASSNILTVEFTMPKNSPGKSFVYEFFTLVGRNATYALDTSPSSNPINLIQVDDIPAPTNAHPQTAVVNPNWLLAAWSVDRNGSLAQNRSAASGIVRGLTARFADKLFNDTALGEDTTLGDDSPADNGVIASSAPNRAVSAESTLAANTTKLQERATVTFASPITTAAPIVIFVSSVSTTAPNSTQAAALIFAISAANAVPTAYNTEPKFYVPSTTVPPTALPTTELTPSSDEQNEIAVDHFDAHIDNPLYHSSDALANFLQLSCFQALSMVDFTKDDITSANESIVEPNHPQLHYYATVHIWMFGINSRTAWLGVVVVCTGMGCVICSTVLGLMSRKSQRSLTDIIVAAIKHQHEGELGDINSSPKHASRLRYKLQDNSADGMLGYRHVD